MCEFIPDLYMGARHTLCDCVCMHLLISLLSRYDGVRVHVPGGGVAHAGGCSDRCVCPLSDGLHGYACARAH